MRKHSLAIVGAGASGMAAAIEASRYAEAAGEKTDITLYERLPKTGKKILATGNGRCNIMNKRADLTKYFGDKKFISDIFNMYSVENNIDFFESLGIVLDEEDEGRLYPKSRQAACVSDALRFEINKYGVNTVCDSPVISVKKINDGFILNGSIKVDALIISGGGKSSSVHGSDGSCINLLSSLGLKTENAFPSLVPIVLKQKNKSLRGIRNHSLLQIVCNDKIIAESEGELQYTDYGISGIPSMEVSHVVSEHFAKQKKDKIYALINSLPDLTSNEIFEYILKRIKANPDLMCEDLLSGILPKKLGNSKIISSGISPVTAISKLSKSDIGRVAQNVSCEAFEINSVLGFDNSQVTAGGVKTDCFFSTLEAKSVNGLFACGEVLNVDALCGGYNLLWAWSSGRCAGKNAAKYLIGEK